MLGIITFRNRFTVCLVTVWHLQSFLLHSLCGLALSLELEQHASSNTKKISRSTRKSRQYVLFNPYSTGGYYRKTVTNTEPGHPALSAFQMNIFILTYWKLTMKTSVMKFIIYMCMHSMQFIFSP